MNRKREMREPAFDPPAITLIIPLDSSRRLNKQQRRSAMMRPPRPSSDSDVGCFIRVSVATLASPSHPETPVPAMTDSVPLLANTRTTMSPLDSDTNMSCVVSFTVTS